MRLIYKLPILWLDRYKFYILPLVIILLIVSIIFVYEYFSFNPLSYRDIKFNSNLDSKIDTFLPDYSKTVLDRNGNMLSIFLNSKEQWHLNSYDPIPYKLKESVLLYEDKRFYTHSGLDLLAVLRTIKIIYIIIKGLVLALLLCKLSRF